MAPWIFAIFFVLPSGEEQTIASHVESKLVCENYEKLWKDRGVVGQYKITKTTCEPVKNVTKQALADAWMDAVMRQQEAKKLAAEGKK